MYRGCFLAIFLLTLSSLVTIAPAYGEKTSSASLSGRVGVYNVYFLDHDRLRHQRYELNLKQTAAYDSGLTTIIEGRFRADAALAPNMGAYEYLAKPVRDDEFTEADIRQAYVDWLVGELRFKVGVQQIDWVESLSLKTSDVITPLDLRHGGFGAASDIIEPVFAVSANHVFPLGALDWLVVPNAKMHRLAAGDNSYGYQDMLNDIAGPNAVVEHRLPTKHVNGVEAGLRYLMYFDGWDASLLAYRGHQRSPTMRVFPLSLSQNLLLQDHPRVNTFGASASMSTDAVVARVFAYVEPDRRPALEVFTVPGLIPDATERSTEDRQRIGIGFDYVHSKHFKIYTETLRTETTYDSSTVVTKRAPAKSKSEDFVASMRMTNETFADWLLSLEVSMFTPKKASIFSPEIQYTLDGTYRIALGARVVRSFANDSPLYYLRESSQAYLALHQLFNVQ